MAGHQPPPSPAQRSRELGNAAFKLKDYAAAARHYTDALQALEKSDAPAAATDGASHAARLPLLTNRSLAHHRLGRYSAAAADAEAALLLDAGSTKAAFRAGAARLMLGDGAGAARRARLLQAAASGEAPPAWAALIQHATALQARQQQQEEHVGASVALAQLLCVLAEEAEGDGGEDEDAASPAELLKRLTAVLSGDTHLPEAATPSAAAAAAAVALEADGHHGYRLLLFFLADADPATRQAAAAALQAAGQAVVGAAAVVWPASVWQRLTAAAAGGRGVAASVALRLLGWAAEQDAWVRQQLLTHPLAGLESNGSPIAQIAALLSDGKRLRQAAPEAVNAAATLLRCYAGDAAAAEALAQTGCQPLLALLRAAEGAAGMAAFAQAEDEESGAAGQGEEAATGTDGGSQGTEQEALRQLHLKRRAVFNAELVGLRRRLLAAAAALASSSRELVAAEAVQAAGSGGGSGKRGVRAGAFLVELLALARQLHEEQPRRTAPVLGPDGTPKAYEKRRFAADFKDNPAGDFLLSLSLSDEESDSAAAAAPGGGSSDGPTLLELVLALLQAVAGASGTAATLLHRRDVLALCMELSSYCTPAVVNAAQRLAATTADGCAAAADELLSAGGGVPGLAALALHAASRARQAAALDRLAGQVDSCSGDGFAFLTGTTPSLPAAAVAECAAFRAWQLAQQGASAAVQSSDGTVQAVARRLLLRCCERAQRQQRLGPTGIPRGGAWGAIGRQPLLQLLQAERQAGGSGGVQKEQAAAPAFSGLSKGFLRPAAAKGAAAAASGAASSSAAAPQQQSYKGGAVLIEELPSAGHAAGPGATAAAPPTPAVAPAAALQQRPEQQQQQQQEQPHEEEEEEESVADLSDVYDSSAGVTPQQRAARAAWQALPPEKRVAWGQTSTDVSVLLAVPAGTRASEVAVDVASGRLSVTLRWHGWLVDGPLHGRVRASEAHWCLEGQEVHVLLPKADGAWWKALLEGGEERSYRQLLQEAVDADEPVQPYEALDDGARALIEAIQERQAYIAEGLIDPEGFDDFRVVIGEESLKG